MVTKKTMTATHTIGKLMATAESREREAEGRSSQLAKETHSRSESFYSVPPPPPPPPLVWLPPLPSQRTHLRDREERSLTVGRLVQWAGQPTSEALSLEERSVPDALGALCLMLLSCLHALDTELNATG